MTIFLPSTHRKFWNSFMMNRCVLPPRNYFKILYSIVILNSILVVDNIKSIKFSFNKLFHNNPMLKNLFFSFSDINKFISSIVNGSTFYTFDWCFKVKSVFFSVVMCVTKSFRDMFVFTSSNGTEASFGHKNSPYWLIHIKPFLKSDIVDSAKSMAVMFVNWTTDNFTSFVRCVFHTSIIPHNVCLKGVYL